MIWIITGIVIVVVMLFVIIAYNSLVSTRNAVKNSWAGIDVQLKRRTDLIPNLISTVKGYMKHERGLLDNLTKARTQIMSASRNFDPNAAAKGDNFLTDTLRSVFAVSEAYPDLKANENFLKLQEQLSETEDQIAAARRIYNENAMYMNNKVSMFPLNIIASMFKFEKVDYFEADPEDKKNIKVEV